MIDTNYNYLNRIREYVTHASVAKSRVDCYAKPDNYTVAAYKLLLQDIYEHPTLGFLIKKEYYDNSSINLPSKFVINKQMLECKEEIVEMREKIRQRVNTLYPRTKYVRQYIKNQNRVNLYYVRPGEGFSILDRFKISLKMLLAQKIK